MRQIQYCLATIIMFVLMVSTGCSVVAIEGDQVVFFLSKEWKIKQVVVNGTEQTGTDVSAYRLNMMDDLTFSRITIDGDFDEGAWSLMAEQSQLVLFPDDPREERYLILDLGIRNLELKVLQDDFKSGEFDIRYLLEPVKK